MRNAKVLVGPVVAWLLLASSGQSSAADIKGLSLKIRTEHENLDRRSKVYATVKANGEVVAKEVVVAAGEVGEDNDHAEVTVDFDKNVPDAAKFTIELTHPGIDGNSDPHWRMTFSVNAVQAGGGKRPTTLKLESSKIYETKGRKHLNFEGGNRSSGEMPFTIE